MNVFNDAIESHVEWKRALKKHVENVAHVDVNQVANCQVCELGKWIYGEGIRYNHLPSFESMCALHEQFHRYAAEVVRRSNEGNKLTALSLLKPEGGYSQSSARLIRALMDCSNEVADSVVHGIRNKGKIDDILRQKTDQNVYKIDGSASVLSALTMMVDHNIGSLAVYEQDQFIGIFSERGYVRNLVLKRVPSLESPCGALVDADATYLGREDSIEQCMRLMTATHMRHLPVMQDSRLVGIISIGDVIKRVISDDADRQSQLEGFIHGHYGA